MTAPHRGNLLDRRRRELIVMGDAGHRPGLKPPERPADAMNGCKVATLCRNLRATGRVRHACAPVGMHHGTEGGEARLERAVEQGVLPQPGSPSGLPVAAADVGLPIARGAAARATALGRESGAGRRLFNVKRPTETRGRQNVCNKWS